MPTTVETGSGTGVSSRSIAAVITVVMLLCGMRQVAGIGRAFYELTTLASSSRSRTPPANDGSDLVNAELPHQQARETTSRPLRDGDWFEDVTAESGIAFAYRDGSEAGFYELIETIGGGVALLDYDRDGRLDVFLTGGGSLVGPPVEIRGRRCALFRNNGNWHFTDVTAQALLTDESLYTHGASVR